MNFLAVHETKDLGVLESDGLLGLSPKLRTHDDDEEHGETPTPAYTLLNAYASYDLSFGDTQGELFIRGNNLLDELGYNHTSPATIKRYAPHPGAGVEVGLGFDF